MPILLTANGWARGSAPSSIVVRAESWDMRSLLLDTSRALGMEWDDYDRSFDRFYDDVMEVVDDPALPPNLAIANTYEPTVDDQDDYVDYLLAISHLMEVAKDRGREVVLELPPSSVAFAEALDDRRRLYGLAPLPWA